MAMALVNGSRVAVLGGGPAGSMAAYFLLTFAEKAGLRLSVDIYEARDFTQPGPAGCNMCGGIVSESLMQDLAAEGINLPTTVVQRGIDSYVLHTDNASVRINTPLHEKRIAAVHRGGGPRDLTEVKWGGLDGYLLGLAKVKGADVIAARVSQVGWDNGHPQVKLRNRSQSYDLLVGAVGVNMAGWKLLESLGLPGEKPKTTKAYITELKLGYESVTALFGSSMHIFFQSIPRLDCAAIIPKGDYVTVCLLGKDIDRGLVDAFFESMPVRRCFPENQRPSEGACHCSPWINIRAAQNAFMDRVVLVGDCGATRLYKDGIGAAYRTAKAAALTAVFNGVSASDFRGHYSPTYRSIARDNRYGKFIFGAAHWVKRLPWLVGGVVKMAAREQRHPSGPMRMSIVLWDMFTGSAPYREVFYRALDPRFLARFVWDSSISLGKGTAKKREGIGDQPGSSEQTAH